MLFPQPFAWLTSTSFKCQTPLRGDSCSDLTTQFQVAIHLLTVTPPCFSSLHISYHCLAFLWFVSVSSVQKRELPGGRGLSCLIRCCTSWRGLAGACTCRAL